MDKKNSCAPYSVDDAKKERSRVLAHKRRATNRSVMDELTKVLPLPKDVVTHLDYSSKLRLALCFFRLKSLTGTVKSEEEEAESEAEPKLEGPSQSTDVVMMGQRRPSLFNLGMLQDLMMEALDGFLLVLSSDGVVIYISESVHHHLGIFQSEHIGISIYDMINEEDQKEVRAAMLKAQTNAMSFRSSEVSFFCRMKCSRFKLSNNVNKNPGHKLVYVSGRMKLMGRDQYLVAVVRPVSPPSVVELRIEANMFVTQYDLQMNCTFFDGRLKHLLGYDKGDLEGRSPFGLQHHEDLGATAKCGEGIMSRGEGLSGYYRFMCRGGFYVWLQTRGMLMHDSRTGKPTHIVCMNYIISKEDGDRDLRIRQAITDSAIPHQKGMNQSYDPFPLTEREDGAKVNPLKETSWGHKENVEMEDVLVKEHTHLVEKEAVVVKKEALSSAGTSPLAKSSDSTSTPAEWSPSDSGMHSNGSHNGTSAFSSTNSIFPSSKNSVSLKLSADDVEHCLPDSTTGSDASDVSGKGIPKQVVSESIVCWDSPSNGVGGSEHSLTPPSVFHEEPASSSPPQTTPHSMSYSCYQNGSVSSGGVAQATTGAASYMSPQGLQNSVPTGPFTPESHQYGHMSTPGFGNFNQQPGGSGTSQPQAGGQLYQLLSKQPPQSGDTIYGNSTGYVNGGGYQQHFTSMNTARFTDPTKGISNKLPAWNGIETEVHVHTIPQQPLRSHFSTGFVNGTNSVQPSWQPDVDPLPQLTDEDMRILDCFNETAPLT